MKPIRKTITAFAAVIVTAAAMLAGANTAMAADETAPDLPKITNVKVTDVGAHSANVSFDYDLTPLGKSVLSNLKNVCFIVDVQRFTDITPISEPHWAGNGKVYTCKGGTDDSDLTQDTYKSIYGVHQDATYVTDENNKATVKATGQAYYRYDNDSWDGKTKGTVTIPVIGLTANTLYGNKNRLGYCSSGVGSSGPCLVDAVGGGNDPWLNVAENASVLWDKGIRAKTKVDVRQVYADVRFESKDSSKPNFDYYGDEGWGSTGEPVADFTTVSEAAAKSESQLPSDKQGELTVPDGTVKAKSVTRVYVENLSAAAKGKADANSLFWYSYIYSDAKQLTGSNGSPYVEVKKDDAGKYYFDAYIPEGYSGDHTISLQDESGAVQAWTKVNVSTAAATVDKTALTTAITNAGKLNQNDYTAATWKTFSDALASAKRLSAKSDATQTQVDAAVKALTAAQAGLKKTAGTAKTNESSSGSLAQTGANVTAIAITTVFMGLIAGAALVLKRVPR